ncbi:MAG: hypothetical protein NTV51_08310 [Verrucomicrobia bacterium]|nr:hypothetical protein [Verrucomicrobiota bacterium]
MYENLDTLTPQELAAIWCDEYARTSGCSATVVKQEGDWIYIKTPSHDGQPWQASHLIVAIQTLRARPDFGCSIYSLPGLVECEAGSRR